MEPYSSRFLTSGSDNLKQWYDLCVRKKKSVKAATDTQVYVR
jgi:hypothetical protein